MWIERRSYTTERIMPAPWASSSWTEFMRKLHILMWYLGSTVGLPYGGKFVALSSCRLPSNRHEYREWQKYTWSKPRRCPETGRTLSKNEARPYCKWIRALVTGSFKHLVVRFPQINPIDLKFKSVWSCMNSRKLQSWNFWYSNFGIGML